MAERLVFRIVKKIFEGEVVTDRKALIACVESVRFEAEDATYKIPVVYQPLDFHETITSNTTIAALVKNSKKTFNREGQYRNVKIKMTEEMRKAYLDEDENFIFRDCVLELDEPTIEETNPTQETQEKRIPPKDDGLRILNKIEASFAIPKFDRSSQKAEDWFQDFELECARFDINTDEMRVRALKYFVKDVAEDWYKASLTQFSIKDLASWKNSFLTVFGDRGWTRVEYAMAFKYLQGSYTDYAIKKLRLLLEIERKMTTESKINSIVVGLPQEIRSQIDKKDVTGVDELMSILSKFETPMKYQKQPWKNDGVQNVKNIEKRNKSPNEKQGSAEKKPCPICLKMNLRNRFHPEEKCWNRKPSVPTPHINLNEDATEPEN